MPVIKEENKINQQKLLQGIKSWKQKARDKYKIDLIALFGSWAKDEAKPDSDIDILINFLPEASLFDWVNLAQDMEDEFHHRVDLVPQSNLKQNLKSYIENDLIPL
ncbi:MAG: nucleotidyltransferase domain-containing protein [Spirochaetia bacterium]|nr:nucleotidyltransferase domain-containing protein [Spirochaetia bacterium]